MDIGVKIKLKRKGEKKREIEKGSERGKKREIFLQFMIMIHLLSFI